MINYTLIADSIDYYKQHSFEYVDAPWVVSSEINNITMPEERQEFIIKGESLVGSGEQSLLQMIKDRSIKVDSTIRRYMTTTSCFRDEEVDALHKRYFVKTELILVSTEPIPQDKYLTETIVMCHAFFRRYIPHVDTEEQEGGRSNRYNNIDLIEGTTEIELGSYGMSHAEINGQTIYWIFATGCAEPRLSTVIELIKKPAYHQAIIPKYRVGSMEKILEEYLELKDATEQGNKIMALVELSDLYGAIEMYLKENYNGIDMKDLAKMAHTTSRAFQSGRRQ